MSEMITRQSFLRTMGPSIVVIALIAGQHALADAVYPSVQSRSHAEKQIAAALDQPVKGGGFDFLDQPLADVCEFLQEVHGINIVIDQHALDREGIDADTPLTQELRGVSLRSALRVMLRPLGLTYSIRNDLLVITTPQSTNAFEVRCYNVGELIQEGATSEQVAIVVSRVLNIPPATQTSDSQGNQRLSRQRTQAHSYRRMATFGNVLMVRDTDSGHEEIAKALASLRDGLRTDGKPIVDEPTAHAVSPAGPMPISLRERRRRVRDEAAPN